MHINTLIVSYYNNDPSKEIKFHFIHQYSGKTTL